MERETSRYYLAKFQPSIKLQAEAFKCCLSARTIHTLLGTSDVHRASGPSVSRAVVFTLCPTPMSSTMRA